MMMTASADGALECMIWAGTVVLWTVAGGVPKSLGLLDRAAAAEAATKGFTFLQISECRAQPDNREKLHHWE